MKKKKKKYMKCLTPEISYRDFFLNYNFNKLPKFHVLFLKIESHIIL